MRRPDKTTTLNAISVPSMSSWLTGAPSRAVGHPPPWQWRRTRSWRRRTESAAFAPGPRARSDVSGRSHTAWRKEKVSARRRSTPAGDPLRRPVRTSTCAEAAVTHTASGCGVRRGTHLVAQGGGEGGDEGCAAQHEGHSGQVAAVQPPSGLHGVEVDPVARGQRGSRGGASAALDAATRNVRLTMAGTPRRDGSTQRMRPPAAALPFSARARAGPFSARRRPARPGHGSPKGRQLGAPRPAPWSPRREDDKPGLWSLRRRFLLR